MSDSKSLRVLHAPRDIGSNAYHLARGERQLGFDSRNVVYFKQWYGYPADISLRMKVDDNPIRYLRWWALMAWAALTCDVFHFNFGSSFLSYYPKKWIFPDVPLWRYLGIATFVTFQGCEGRVSRYVLENLEIKCCTHCRSREFCAGGYDDYKLEANSVVGRYFDGVFALNPDIIRSIPDARFLPYCNVDLDSWQPPTGFDWYHQGPVKILHAPTNREIKGTDTIIKAVESLQAEGQNVELVLVENIPHKQVRQLYESADLLVDQILVGWYGGLAVELMALGKPVIAYIRQDDLQFIPKEMKEELPVISADSATLTNILRELVQNTEMRRKIGQQSRAFVEKWHHPKVVSKMTTDAYHEALSKRSRVVGASNRLRVLLKIAKPVWKQYASIYRTNFPPAILARKLINVIRRT
jgi:glycosyltransferase involved in cell wall biosynthesis